MTHYLKTKYLGLFTLIFVTQNVLAQKTTFEDVKLNLRYGNMSAIKRIDISPDGKTMASLDYNGYIVLWDINSRIQYTAIDGISESISEIIFSPDGKTLIGTGRKFFNSNDDYLFYWDYKSGNLIKKVPLEYSIDEMSLTPDRKMLFTYGGKFGIQIRDIDSGEVIKKIKLGLLGTNSPQDLVLSPNQDYIACVTWMPIRGGKQALNVLKVISSKGEKMKEGYIQILDFETGKPRKEIFVGSDEDNDSFTFYDIVISPDSKYIIAAGEFKKNRRVLFIDAETEKVVKESKVLTTILAVSPDNKYLYAGANNIIRKIDMVSLEVVSEFNAYNHLESGDSDEKIIYADEDKGKTAEISEMGQSIFTDLKFPSGGKYFITAKSSGTGAFSIDLWDYKTEKQLANFDSPIAKVNSASYSPIGNKLLIGTKDGDIQILDLTTGRLNNTFKLLQGNVLAQYSPSYKYIIGSSIDTKNFISLGFFKFRYPQITKIWDSNTYELVDSIPGYSSAIMSDDGKYLMVVQQLSFQNLWRLYDLSSRKLLNENKSMFQPVAFTKDNLGVLSFKGGSFNIFDLVKFKKTLKVKDVKGGRLQDVKFNPDKTRIIAALAKSNYKGELREWDINGKLVRIFLDEEESKVLSSTYSPDGKSVMCGLIDEGFKATTKIFDANSGNLLNSAQHFGLPICFTDDGKYLIAYADVHFKGINLVDLSQKEILGTYLKIKDKPDGLFFTPKRYYSSTKDGYEAISYFYNEKTYPFEQFDLKFNRPDIIASQMPYSNKQIVKLYEKAYQKRLDKMGVNSEALSDEFNVPQIVLKNYDDLPVSTENKSIILEVFAEDKFPLLSYNVWVNDVPVYGIKGNSIEEGKMSIDIAIDIELSKGVNKIQVSCLNNAGIESTKITRYTEYVGPVKKPDLYLISIGISNFEESEYDLNYAAKDAGDFSNSFSNDTDMYDEVFIKELLNEDVTSSNIIALKEFLNKCTVDDRVVIFYAGHGLLDDDLNYYLSTYNVDFEDPSNNGLLFQNFEGIIDGVVAREKIVFIDACHSGEIDKDESLTFAESDNQTNENISFRGFKKKKIESGSTDLTNSFEIMKEIFVDLRRGTGAYIISSAGGGEFAYEGQKWKNGVFTYSILSGISDGNSDLDKDGTIMLSELANKVQSDVRRLTNGKQNPTFRQENLEFDIPLRRINQSVN